MRPDGRPVGGTPRCVEAGGVPCLCAHADQVDVCVDARVFRRCVDAAAVPLCADLYIAVFRRCAAARLTCAPT
jgi:hypothetical protein